MKDDFIKQIELKNKMKNKTVAWLLAIFLGFYGGHCFYIGEKWLGITILITCLSIILLPVSAIFFVYSLFLINRSIDKHNNKVISDYLQ